MPDRIYYEFYEKQLEESEWGWQVRAARAPEQRPQHVVPSPAATAYGHAQRQAVRLKEPHQHQRWLSYE